MSCGAYLHGVLTGILTDVSCSQSEGAGYIRYNAHQARTSETITDRKCMQAHGTRS